MHQSFLATLFAFGIMLVTMLPAASAQEWVAHELPGDSDPEDGFGWASVDIASSADGSRLAIVTEGGAEPEYGGILVSTDYGDNWTLTSAPLVGWNSIATSASGTKLVAAGRQGVYTSADSGVTWVQRLNPAGGAVKAVASSADGVKLVAVADQAAFGIYTSADSGVTWQPVTAPPGRANGNGIHFHGAASSANGNRLIAIADRDDPANPVYEVRSEIYRSTDGGSTWSFTQLPAAGNEILEPKSVASSADGLRLALTADYSNPGVAWHGRVYTSNNGGDNWTAQPAAPLEVNADIASSADGSRLFLGGPFLPGSSPVTFGKLYVSENAGVSWQSADAPVNPFDATRQLGWEQVASSADGNQLAATPYNFGDEVYTRASGILSVTYEIRPPPEVPNQFMLCDDIHVVARVTNISAARVTELRPGTAPVSGVNGVLKIQRGTSPGTPQTLEPGAFLEFSWILRAQALGDASLAGTFTGKTLEVPFTANSAASFTLQVLQPEIIVNLTTDEPDADLLDGCADVNLEMAGRQTTLRAAIETANVMASLPAGEKRPIYFNIPGAGVPRIAPRSSLPPVAKTVKIVGDSQPAGRVELHGALASGAGDGLEVRAASTIRNLVVNGWKRAGVVLSGTGGHSVLNCRIGTDIAGAAAVKNKFGIAVLSSDNIIGGASGLANVISGNSDAGISIEKPAGGAVPLRNRVMGNRIGTSADGTQALESQMRGVSLLNAADSRIGEAGQGNLISGNTVAGIMLAGGECAANRVEANLIGTSVTGSATVENLNGVVLRLNAHDNIIGGETVSAANVISGNGAAGVRIQEVAYANQITGNLIGLNQSGSARLPNNEGIFILDGLANRIGGSTAAKRNVISGNLHRGITLSAGSSRDVPEQRLCNGTVIEGNWIGLSRDGLHTVANGLNFPASDAGIALLALAQNTLIGGSGGGQGNVISGNTGFGIGVGVSRAFTNSVLGNRIGVLPDGVTPAGNTGSGVGVAISSQSQIVVGGSAAGAGNRIAYNGGSGVDIKSISATALPCPVLANEIYRNKGRGILLADKRPLNDNGDSDAGPNALQNYPFLRNARNISGGTRVLVDLKTFRLNETFRVDFYRHHPGDPQSGGDSWLSALAVLTGTQADGLYVATLPLQFSGSVITATATDSAGNTSEFSNAVFVSAAADRDLDGTPDEEEAAGGRVPIRTRNFSSGDGNGDGFQDADQANVATMMLADSGWFSVVSPAGSALSSVQTVDPAGFPPLPVPWVSRRELVTFSLTGAGGGSVPLTWIEAPVSEVQQLWRWTGTAWIAAGSTVTTDESNGTRRFTFSLPSSSPGQTIVIARAFTPLPLPSLKITALPDDAGLLFPSSSYSLPEIASAQDFVTVTAPQPAPVPLVPGRRIRLTVSPAGSSAGAVLQWSRDLGVTERWQDIHPSAGSSPGEYDLSFPPSELRGYFRLSRKGQ